RALVETRRAENWTILGIPTAQSVTLGFILAGVIGLIVRHGPRRGQLAVELLPDRSSEPSPDELEDDFWSEDLDPDADARASEDEDDFDDEADGENDGDDDDEEDDEGATGDARTRAGGPDEQQRPTGEPPASRP